MADNFVADAGTADGARFVGATLTFSGDADAIATGVFQMIITGSEGAWTPTVVVGGAGAVTGGVQRVTLASDDPAVVDLAAIEVLLTSANVDHAANEVLLTIIAGDTASVDGKITACDTGAVVLSSGTVTTVSTVTNLSQLGGQAVSMGTGVRDVGTQRVTIATNDSVPVTGTFWQATQPISGTVAATQSGAWNVTNVSGTVSLPTGASTAANQATLIADTNAMVIDLAAIEVLLGTIDADTGNIATNTTGLAGCISGTELQVDVVAALPAGTNAIGKLAANSGVDIGDVDVTSIAAGTNTIGGTIAQASTSVAYDGTTSCTIKRASGVAASGTTAIVAAVAGKKIRILAFAAFGTAATANTMYLATTTDTDVLGNAGNPIPIAVDADADNVAGFVLPWNPGGWTETSTANEALNLILSAAVDVIYAITYIEVS